MFKKTRRLPDEDIDLVLLLDASGSMANETEVYDAAKAVHKVIPEVKVVSYYANYDGTRITVHTGTKGVFKEVKVDGGTPSGLALLATARQFPTSHIIHFTDGGSNVGPDPTQVFPIIAKKYPKVHIVDLLYRNAMRGRPDVNQDKNVTELRLTDIKQFPHKLREAIRPWYKQG